MQQKSLPCPHIIHPAWYSGGCQLTLEGPQDAALYQLVLYAITRTGDVFRFQQQNTRNFHRQGFLLFSNMKKKVILSPTLPWTFKDQFSWHKYRALRLFERRIGQSRLPLNPRGLKITGWFFFSMFSDYSITLELFWYCSAGAIVEQFHIQSPSCLNPSQASNTSQQIKVSSFNA